jgi:hypothetical protein
MPDDAHGPGHAGFATLQRDLDRELGVLADHMRSLAR